MSRKCHPLLRSGAAWTPAGFTLIEMLVVLAIIGTLAMLVGPTIFRNVGDANVIAARSQVETLAVALESYRLDTNAYPTTEQGLAALRDRPGTDSVPGWRGPYLRKSVPPDPWKHAYVYLSPGIKNPDSYDLYSLGRDGVPGGAGEDTDLTSWGGPLQP